MGLDTVELVMAIEEEFQTEIPDADAEKLVTIGDIHQYLCRVNKVPQSRICVVRSLFYKVRKALIKVYGLDRRSIAPKTRVRDLLSKKLAANGWHGLGHVDDLVFPEFEWKRWTWDKGEYVYNRTVGELAIIMLALNRKTLEIEPGSTEDYWLRLIDVIIRQLNVHVIELRPDASVTRDLGAE